MMKHKSRVPAVFMRVQGRTFRPMPRPPSDKSFQFWLLAAVIVLAVAGCWKKENKEPPPVPTAPPPESPVQAPPPPRVSMGDVAALLQPYFFILFDRGFRPAGVETPARYPVVLVDGWLKSVNGDFRYSAALQQSVRDAVAATPALEELVAEQLSGGAPDQANAAAKWAQFVRTLPVPADGTPVTKRIRRMVLGSYFQQALADADQRNFHRAHVILSDIGRVLAIDDDFTGPTGFVDFRRFFEEVPDAQRFESFARTLESYTSACEETLLVGGEHAAILNAAGLHDAANFMRDKLLARLDMVTLPLIAAAIVRGESYTFAPPKQLTETRKRLVEHEGVLRRGRKKEPLKPHLAEAASVKASEGYAEKFSEFAALVTAGAGKAASAGSVEKAARSLQGMTRPIGQWVREKVLCAAHCPMYMLEPGTEQLVVELSQPVVYVSAQAKFVSSNPAAVVSPDSSDTLAGNLKAWCAGEPLHETLQHGGGHFLAAWYWLESGRPNLARSGLLAGAEHLLAVSRAADIETLRADPVRNAAALAAVLQAECNAYRMMLAAAAIRSTPAGAAADGGDSYLAELQVLMTAWRQAWLKCGLPEAAANDAVRLVEIESRKAAAIEAAPQRPRYHFFDYRFTYGPVPDVVVRRAHETELFSAEGKSHLEGEGMKGFWEGFLLPREFSKSARTRWGAE